VNRARQRATRRRCRHRGIDPASQGIADFLKSAGGRERFRASTIGSEQRKASMSDFKVDDYGKDPRYRPGLFTGSLVAGLVILGSLMLL
jgi:hypothetical protein